jgi:hypothetical protein
MTRIVRCRIVCYESCVLHCREAHYPCLVQRCMHAAVPLGIGLDEHRSMCLYAIGIGAYLLHSHCRVARIPLKVGIVFATEAAERPQGLKYPASGQWFWSTVTSSLDLPTLGLGVLEADILLMASMR